MTDKEPGKAQIADQTHAAGPVPAGWMPDAEMNRIITHWSVTGYKATDSCRNAYHISIEGDGNLVIGNFSIKDNESNLVWEPLNYAAHTKDTNSHSIGISVCCMEGADEDAADYGPCPMTEAQWNKMAEVAAQLCARYDIAVTPQTVLGHGEVEDILQNPQDGKWDPLVLPWNTALSKPEAGDAFRAKVQAILDAR